MLRLSQQGILLAGLPLALQLFGASLLFVELQRLDTKLGEITQAEKISNQCNELLSDVLECGTIISYNVASAENSGSVLDDEYATIRRHVLSDAEKLLQFEYSDSSTVQKLSHSVREVIDKFDALKSDSRMSFFRALEFRRVRPMLKDITDQCREIVASEKLNASEDVGSLLHRQRFIEQSIIFGLIANAIVVAMLIWYFNRNTAARLRTLVENSYNLASDRPLLAPLNGNDEFANLDQTFHEMAQSLRDSDAAKRRILETVAHDLRSPLTSIHIALSMLELDLKGVGNESLQTQVFDCMNIVDRLLRMINDILDIESFTSGTLPVDLRYISLKPIIQKSVETLMNIATSRDQKLLIRNLSDLEVRADPDRIEQVLINLITNAIKYSKDGATTEVSCVESSEWIEVQVKDSGRGLPASAKKYLFDRYRQLLPDDKQKGKGLGLSIAKTIIDAHDGMIGCESEPGLGSIFWFRLKRVGKA